jgi:dienelactone hydrolase
MTHGRYRSLATRATEGYSALVVRVARRAASVAILVALWLGTARADTHSVDVTLPAPATLTAEFSTPSGAGPFPAVILLHGCGGVGPHIKDWAVWFRHEGYAALVLDSFGGRGLKRLCGGSAALTGRMRAPDVYAAARYLKTLPQIDGKRIAAIGYSHGGWTLMWALATEAQYPDVDIRAFIMFYPTCTGWKTLPGTTPVLMLLGGKDDWTPAAPCEALARTRGHIKAIVYRDAYHAFDSAGITGRRTVSDARGGLGATIEYNPRAHEDAEKQVRAFLAANLKR